MRLWISLGHYEFLFVLTIDRCSPWVTPFVTPTNISSRTMSRLAGLVLNLLSTQGRPLEAATLKGLLRNPTTSAKAEYFLRYTVVRDLVAQLQSPNPASVLRDVHPFLVESSTHFIHMVEKQFPVSRERYSCPTFLWWCCHCHIYSLHVGTEQYSLPLYLHVMHERFMPTSSAHVSHVHWFHWCAIVF